MPSPSFFKRLMAMIYDGVLVSALLFIAATLVLALRKGEAVPPGTPWFTLYLLGVVFVFFGWFWTHGGQTLGLKTWKMRVVDFDNRPITWNQALLRYLAAILSWACFGLGFFWMLVDKEKLTWHDRISKTRLINIQLNQ